MIKVSDLDFHYSRKAPILQSLNMTFRPGHIYGLLGKNGAGKSTLIKNITGMLFPTGGKCSVFDQQPKERSLAFLKDLFFVPEDYYLPYIPINKLIEIYGSFYPNFDSAQFDGYIKSFGFDKSRKVGDLSLGQKKKVLIGFALSTNTRVLIMDEPTNGLDIPSKVTFRNMVNSAFNSERIVIISSHQVRDLDELIHNIIIMHEGKVLLSASKEHIAKQLTFHQSTEKIESDHTIYQEKVSNGYASITQNMSEELNYVDIELLFNAALSTQNFNRYL